MEQKKRTDYDGLPTKRNTLTFTECWDEIFERTISKDKLYAIVRAGSIPHVKIGSKILFRRDAMAAWFQQQEENNSIKQLQIGALMGRSVSNPGPPILQRIYH